MTSGVPQGTVLGPVLFNLFINGIVDGIKSEIRLFADDCICYRIIRSRDDCDQLQRDISTLGSWARQWSMKFEPSKCKTMHISRKTRHNITHLYHLDGIALDSVTEAKYLGVTITCDLRWNRHVTDITNRANRVLGLLRRNLSACKRDVKEAANVGLVRPLLEYASPIWDPHTASLSAEIEKVQRRAARFVLSDYNYEPGAVTSLLNKLNWTPLKKRRTLNRLCLFNKGRQNLAKLPITNLTRPSRSSRHMHSQFYYQPFTLINIASYLTLFMTGTTFPQDIINICCNMSVFESKVLSYIS